MRMLSVLSVLVLASAAKADEVILTNGKTIQFRILKDAGDTIALQTVDNQTISVPRRT